MASRWRRAVAMPKGERLVTVDELIAKIMVENAKAKRLAWQDKNHALRHAEINRLLCELQERSGTR